MSRPKQLRRLASGGFTMPELMIAASITVIVMAISLGVFINMFKSWHGIELRMQADRDVNIAMSRMVYGMGDRLGIRSASDVAFTSNSTGWTLSYPTGGSAPQSNSFAYSTISSNLVFNPGSQIAGKNLSYALAIVNANSVVVTLRVDTVDGALTARREIGTVIYWRN